MLSAGTRVTSSPNVRPVAALKARAWIAQGTLGEALGWAREQGLSADDDLSYLREFKHITLARILLARSAEERAEHSVREVTRLLERLLLAAEGRRREDGTGHRDPGTVAVTNRRAAVRRAAELGLSPARNRSS